MFCALTVWYAVVVLELTIVVTAVVVDVTVVNVST